MVVGDPPGGGGGGKSGKVVEGGIKLGKGALARLKNIEKILEEERSTYTVTGMGLVTGYADMVEARMKSIEESIRTISAAGLTFAKGSKVNIALNTVSTMMDKLAGNAKLGSDAISALSKNMEIFPMLAETSTGFAESLGLQAASLDRLGISFQQYTKNIDIAQNMFNMTEKQVLGLNQGLKDFADEMKMMPSVVSNNFQLVAKSLGYEAPKIAEQFKNMQRLSQQTGVSVGTLMSGFGERLDTVSGAAGFVSQLNAILGTNAFSPNEILMMDEDERMLRVREVIRAHPIYGEIMSGGKIGKFALNTMSKVIGYSKEDTRKFLSGNIEGGVFKPGEADSAKSKAAKGVSEAAQASEQLGTLVKQLEKGLSPKELISAITKNTETMQNLYLSPTDRALVGERGKMIGAVGSFGERGGRDIFAQAAKDPTNQRVSDLQSAMFKGMKAQALTRFGIGGLDELVESLQSAEGFKGTAFSTTDTAGEAKRLNASLIAISRMPQITRVFEALQTLPITPRTAELRKKLGNLISKVGQGTPPDAEEMKKIEGEVADLLQNSAQLAKPFRKGDDDITYLETQAIASASKLTGKGALGFYRKTIRLARESTNDEDFKTRFEEMKVAAEADGIRFDQAELDKDLTPSNDPDAPPAPSVSPARTPGGGFKVPKPNTGAQPAPQKKTGQPDTETGMIDLDKLKGKIVVNLQIGDRQAHEVTVVGLKYEGAPGNPVT